MQFNTAQREVVLKVVYYGPPLSGKTSNLHALHRMLNPDHCGRLTTLDTANDRTLFFDLLPLSLETRAGYRIKLKVFTVPGQVIHAATRRLVLTGADAVVFVADSQRSEAGHNNEFWRGMRRFLTENSIDPDTIPIVIQFNKRDLPDVRTDEELLDIARKGKEPIYAAVAVKGTGVLDTLHGLLHMLVDDLERRYEFSSRFQISADELTQLLLGDFRPSPAIGQGSIANASRSP